MNETLRVIRNRRTIRNFKPDQIGAEEVQAIVEAGIYAPSSNNGQPWHFTVVQDREIIQQLNDQTKNIAKNLDNEKIQKMLSDESFDIFYGAPTLIVVSGEDSSRSAQTDCAAATQNMLLAAESLNLGGCWNGFIGLLFNSDQKDKCKEQLNIPAGYSPFYAIALGYKASDDASAPARRENTVQYIK